MLVFPFRLEVPTSTARKSRTLVVVSSDHKELQVLDDALPKAQPAARPLIAAVVYVPILVIPTPKPAGQPTAAFVVLHKKWTRISTRNRRPGRHSSLHSYRKGKRIVLTVELSLLLLLE